MGCPGGAVWGCKTPIFCMAQNVPGHGSPVLNPLFRYLDDPVTLPPAFSDLYKI
jgi:hypothetical protein